MKTKEILALALFGVVLAVTATLLIGRFGKGSKARSAQIEVVSEISPEFDQEARNILLGHDERQPSQSFDPQLNLPQGLNNTSPFRPGD